MTGDDTVDQVHTDTKRDDLFDAIVDEVREMAADPCAAHVKANQLTRRLDYGDDRQTRYDVGVRLSMLAHDGVLEHYRDTAKGAVFRLPDDADAIDREYDT